MYVLCMYLSTYLSICICVYTHIHMYMCICTRSSRSWRGDLSRAVRSMYVIQRYFDTFGYTPRGSLYTPQVLMALITKSMASMSFCRQTPETRTADDQECKHAPLRARLAQHNSQTTLNPGALFRASLSLVSVSIRGSKGGKSDLCGSAQRVDRFNVLHSTPKRSC